MRCFVSRNAIPYTGYFKDVSFNVRAGEIVGLGRSGWCRTYRSCRERLWKSQIQMKVRFIWRKKSTYQTAI